MNIAYVAGFMDGEGHIARPKPGRADTYSVFVQLVQTESADTVLTEIQRYLSETHKIRSSFYKARPMARGRRGRPCSLLYVMETENVYRFLKAVRPHLIVKAADADRAIEFLEARMTKLRQREDRYREALWHYVHELYSFKQCLRSYGVSDYSFRKYLVANGVHVRDRGEGVRLKRRRGIPISPLLAMAAP